MNAPIIRILACVAVLASTGLADIKRYNEAHDALHLEVESILQGEKRVSSERNRLQVVQRKINRTMAGLNRNAGEDTDLDASLWEQYWEGVAEYVDYAESLRRRDLKLALPILETLKAKGSYYHDLLYAWIYWKYVPGPVDLQVVRHHALLAIEAGDPRGCYIAGMLAESVPVRRMYFERGAKMRSIDCALALAELLLAEKEYPAAYWNALLVERPCGYAPVGMSDNELRHKLRLETEPGFDGSFTSYMVYNFVTSIPGRDNLSARAKSVLAAAKPHFSGAERFERRIKDAGLKGMLNGVLGTLEIPAPSSLAEPIPLDEMRAQMASKSDHVALVRQSWAEKAEKARAEIQAQNDRQDRARAEQQAYLDRLDRERAEREGRAIATRAAKEDLRKPASRVAVENSNHPSAVLPVRMGERGLGAFLNRNQQHATRPDEVLVEYIVDETGKVTHADAKEYGYRESAEAAVAIVRKWKFQPGTINGRAVPMSLQTPITFTRP